MDQMRRRVRETARHVRRLAALPAARRLRQHADPRVAAAGRAIFAAAVPSRSQDPVIGRIERRRNELLNSSTTLEVLDFGAGRATSSRTDEEMRRGVLATTTVAKAASFSKSRFWATFLFEFVREIRPSTAVELGTCVGISAAYQAGAMRLAGHGRLVTLEGDPSLAALSAETLESLGLENASVTVGPFHDTLDPVLAELGTVDYFFNDGHHDEHAVERYFEQALPYLPEHGVIVLDDIAWSPGMTRAWERVSRHDRVAYALDLGTIGIVFLGSTKYVPSSTRVKL